MSRIKRYIEFNDTILILYHGTDKAHADMLLANGWQPNKVSSGSHQGQPKYLYLTTEYDDAMWFANEKGDDVVLELEVPLSSLRFDPEDGCADLYNNDIMFALNKEKISLYPCPIKLVAYKDIPSEHIRLAHR